VAHKHTREPGPFSEDDVVFQVAPEEARRIRRGLFRPHVGRFAVIGAIAIVLSGLTSAAEMSMAPILEIVLRGPGAIEEMLAAEAQPFTFDLNRMGLVILRAVGQATGFTRLWDILVVTSLGFLALSLISEAALFGIRYLAERLRARVTVDFSHRIYKHILHLPLSFLHKHQAGWLQSRLINDGRGVAMTLNQLLIDGSSNILLSTFYVILLIRTDFRLALIAAAAGAIHIGVSRGLGKLIVQRIRGELGSIARMQAEVQERLMAVRDVKVLAGEAHERTTFLGMARDYAQAALRHYVIERVEPPLRTAINKAVIVAVMLFGAWELMNGRLTTSGFLLFMFFAQKLIAPLATLTGVILQIQSVNASLEGIVYILSQAPEVSSGRPLPPGGFREALVVKDLSFSYKDLPVLRNISLTIKKGEMVALVGRSGAGKTTLVDLLLRLYETPEGCIELDGTSVADFDLTAYRRLFGVVPQDAFLFNETVANNIAYARPGLTHEDVEQAARIANAEGFILNDLPNGYDTMLGERGVLVSGGQRQRIAIARAVAHRPQILVLDEATSSLDTESERMVQDAITRVVKGCTAIVIAHRLSTVRMADKIVVLKEGQIIETGSHKELLALNGEYRYLYDLQFQDASAGAESADSVGRRAS